MERNLGWAFLIVMLLAVACMTGVDVDAERAALLDRDREWSEMSYDIEQIVSFFAAGGSFLAPNTPIATGTDAIREVLEHVAAMPGFDLHWSVVEADVSAAGDLGYTRGTYEMTVNDPSGNPTTEKGKYVTVWKKDGAGQWMVVADIFNADTPPPAEPTAP